MLLMAVLAGCGTCKPGKPGPVGKYSIEVSLDESLKTSSVIVDLVGVNLSSLPSYEAYDMGRKAGYWKPGDVRGRDADKVVLDFVSDPELTKTMPITDPHWAKWVNNGVTHVMVLADLPGEPPSRPGIQDARRQILPLDQCAWPDKTKVLKVKVQRSGIVVSTQMRQVK